MALLDRLKRAENWLQNFPQTDIPLDAVRPAHFIPPILGTNPTGSHINRRTSGMYVNLVRVHCP